MGKKKSPYEIEVKITTDEENTKKFKNRVKKITSLFVYDNSHITEKEAVFEKNFKNLDEALDFINLQHNLFKEHSYLVEDFSIAVKMPDDVIKFGLLGRNLDAFVKVYLDDENIYKSITDLGNQPANDIIIEDKKYMKDFIKSRLVAKKEFINLLKENNLKSIVASGSGKVWAYDFEGERADLDFTVKKEIFKLLDRYPINTSNFVDYGTNSRFLRGYHVWDAYNIDINIYIDEAKIKSVKGILSKTDLSYNSAELDDKRRIIELKRDVPTISQAIYFLHSHLDALKGSLYDASISYRPNYTDIINKEERDKFVDKEAIRFFPGLRDDVRISVYKEKERESFKIYIDFKDMNSVFDSFDNNPDVFTKHIEKLRNFARDLHSVIKKEEKISSITVRENKNGFFLDVELYKDKIDLGYKDETGKLLDIHYEIRKIGDEIGEKILDEVKNLYESHTKIVEDNVYKSPSLK